MARGKVVFTGAGAHFKEHYNLTETVAIDATPNAQKVAKDLIELVNHPEKLKAISQNARHFVERHHDYRSIAQNYIDSWT
jgi:3-methyladenine DNA glycosylase Tag